LSKVPRINIFGDESGNFDFSRGRGASRYFILTTVTMTECAELGREFQELRHQMAWEGISHPGPFHANADPQKVRARVFGVLAAQAFRVDSLILEKAKAQPHIRLSDARFYQYAWFYLLKHIFPRLGQPQEALVVSASVGSHKKRAAFDGAVRDVVAQIGPLNCKTSCWDASSDACLQAADYCGWAIQRKWEGGDAGPHALIADKIRSEFDMFARGTQTYY
jgi:hypothetical protein